MNLDEAKKQQVTAWIEEGLKLSEIQTKLVAEFGLKLTYMETRLLVDDLKLMPKDHAPPQATTQISGKLPAEEAAPPADLVGTDAPPAQPGAGAVSVTVDRVARPGALVSGSVTFSDANSAAWYLDQTGRLALVPKDQGYRPPPQDVQTFQLKLQSELAKLGF